MGHDLKTIKKPLRNHKDFDISSGCSKAITNLSLFQSRILGTRIQGLLLLLLKDDLLDLGKRSLFKMMPLNMMVGLTASQSRASSGFRQAAKGFTQLARAGSLPITVLSSSGKGFLHLHTEPLMFQLVLLPLTFPPHSAMRTLTAAFPFPPISARYALGYISHPSSQLNQPCSNCLSSRPRAPRAVCWVFAELGHVYRHLSSDGAPKSNTVPRWGLMCTEQ